MKTFHYMVTTTGNLLCNFVFEDKKALDTWIAKDFPKLQKQHKKLDFSVRPLPGLKVGDSCHVWGEADDVFKIERLVKFEEHRYGFVLDSGFIEEVAKCYSLKH